MPANQKYLTTSGWQRAGKITAAILGGYMVSIGFHLALTAWFDHKVVLITAAFSGFILWVALMILAFLSRSALKVWLLYVSITIVMVVIAYLGKWYNPQFLH